MVWIMSALMTNTVRSFCYSLICFTATLAQTIALHGFSNGKVTFLKWGESVGEKKE